MKTTKSNPISGDPMKTATVVKKLFGLYSLDEAGHDQAQARLTAIEGERRTLEQAIRQLDIDKAECHSAVMAHRYRIQNEAIAKDEQRKAAEKERRRIAAAALTLRYEHGEFDGDHGAYHRAMQNI
jgi:hypothetical protein